MKSFIPTKRHPQPRHHRLPDARTSTLVLGGGLTSAQIVDLALKKGVSHVTLLTREDLKVTPFDVDLAWKGMFKNTEKAAFWSADTDEQRSSFTKSARQAGPPRRRTQKSWRSMRLVGCWSCIRAL